MNNILFNYFNIFFIVYLNNILIYLKNEKNYIKYVIKIFIKF